MRSFYPGQGRRISFFGGLVLFVMCLVLAVAYAGDADSDAELVRNIERNIDWYRRVNAFEAEPVSSQEVIFRDALRDNSRLALRLAFDYSKAQAAIIELQRAGAAATTNPSSRSATILKTAADVAQRVSSLQAELDRIKAELGQGATTQPALAAQRDKVQAELNLALSRREVLANLAGFLKARDGAESGLLEKVEHLERSVPEVMSRAVSQEATGAATASKTASAVPQNTNAAASTPLASTPMAGLLPAAGNDGKAPEATPPAETPSVFTPQSEGIFSLSSEIFRLSRRIGELQTLEDDAAALRSYAEALRDPVRTELRAATARGDELATTRPGAQSSELTQQTAELNALASHFRLIAAEAVPLSEQSVYLESCQNELKQWRETQFHQSQRALHYLLMRLGVLAIGILIVLGISSLWRIVTFRYLTDTRRRRQFLLMRRIIVSVIIVLVVISSFVTEFGSLATFAGLITAGVAVALQTVILSGVASFFYMGRYGVRVGDRVTVSGITGEVIDIGLFRLYLMELAGNGSGPDLSPTGRIVVFSNSVLFQPSAFFKQIPGTSYQWHEIAIEIKTGADYARCEKELMTAVDSVYKEYRDTIDRQHEAVKKSLHLHIPKPAPEGRLRFVQGGLEFRVRYPVESHRGVEIDNKLTRCLLDVVAKDADLKIVDDDEPQFVLAEKTT